MKKILFFFILSTFSVQAASIVLVEDNFDDTLGGLKSGNNSAKVTVTTDPTGSGRGNVGSVDIGNANGTSVWGEVRGAGTSSGTFDIPAQAIAGTDTYTLSVDIYIPSDTTFNTADGPDRFNMILRWNGVNTNNHNVRHNWDSLAADQWHTVTLSNTLPTLGGDGLALTTAIPILSFYDKTNDAIPGVAAYIDNFSLSVTAIPEPSAGVLGILSGLILLRRRR